jgi:nucleotide-binding universal stress UspA family protein
MATSMLVTLDGSAWSEGILDTAARFAAAMQATVYLLRVFHPVRDVGQALPTSGPEGNALSYSGVAPPETQIREVETATQAAERVDNEALAYLRPLVSRFPGLKVQCLVRETAHTADAILTAADEQRADIIVMATHGRSGLAHMVMGSVAEAVVRAGKFPVLLYRPTA